MTADRPATEPRTLADLDKLAAPLHARVVTREGMETMTRLAYEKGLADATRQRPANDTLKAIEAAQGAAPRRPWTVLYDDYDKGTAFITDDPVDEQTAIASGLPYDVARNLAETHNASLRAAPLHLHFSGGDWIECKDQHEGAAPRAEGLLEAATALADATAAEHADCTSDHCHWCPLVDAVRAASRPSDERVPESEEPR